MSWVARLRKDMTDSANSEPRLIRTGIPQLLPMRDRAPGIHVSGVIHSLCVQLGHYQPKEEWSESDITRMQLGQALEDTLARRWVQEFPDRYVSLGGLCKDGLHGTPDMFNIEDGGVEEIKMTWMSSRHTPDSLKYWKYRVQVMAYCQILGTEIGRLHVCCVNGNYKYDEGGGPDYKVWEWHFTSQELEENWRMLTSHAERYGDDIREG